MSEDLIIFDEAADLKPEWFESLSESVKQDFHDPGHDPYNHIGKYVGYSVRSGVFLSKPDMKFIERGKIQRQWPVAPMWDI